MAPLGIFADEMGNFLLLSIFYEFCQHLPEKNVLPGIGLTFQFPAIYRLSGR